MLLIKLCYLNFAMRKTLALCINFKQSFFFTIRKKLIINKLKSSANFEQFPNTVIGISFRNDA